MTRCSWLSQAIVTAVVSSMALVHCTPTSIDATRQPTRSHAKPPPQSLPQDYIKDSAPTPPPNHDGGLTRDAGRDFDTAVPFKEAVRDGRIAEGDDGDGWVLAGPAGQVLSVDIHNLSGDTILAYELLDHNERAVLYPPSNRLYAHESVQHTIELPRGNDEVHLLLLITADEPLSYEIRTETL